MKPRFVTNDKRREILKGLAIQADTEAFAQEVEVARREALLAASFQGITETAVETARASLATKRMESDRLTALGEPSDEEILTSRKRWLADGDEESGGTWPGWIAHTEIHYIAAEAKQQTEVAKMWDIAHGSAMTILATLEVEPDNVTPMPKKKKA